MTIQVTSSDNGATWTTIVTLDNSQSGALNTTSTAVFFNFSPGAWNYTTMSFPLLAGSNRPARSLISAPGAAATQLRWRHHEQTGRDFKNA